MTRTVPLKVADEGARALANIAKVHRLPALAEEQQPVEHLEQLRGRLVDRAQDREALIGEVTQEGHDGPCALRVEPRRGLVEEEKQAGLCCG